MNFGNGRATGCSAARVNLLVLKQPGFLQAHAPAQRAWRPFPLSRALALWDSVSGGGPRSARRRPALLVSGQGITGLVMDALLQRLRQLRAQVAVDLTIVETRLGEPALIELDHARAAMPHGLVIIMQRALRVAQRLANMGACVERVSAGGT